VKGSEGVKSALGSLGLIRKKVGLEKASFYLDQPQITQSGKPALSARLMPPTARSTNSFTPEAFSCRINTTLLNFSVSFK
jgi:hypothetical protein